jgi:L-fuconolactonase
MKIDSHQHFWKYNSTEFGWINAEMNVLKKDFLPEALYPELVTVEFDGSIAVQARQSLEETRWLLKLAGRNKFIKGVVGWVDLCSKNLEIQLDDFARHSKAVGVRHVVHDEPDDNFIIRPDFIQGIKHLERFGLSYDILIFPKHLTNTIKFVKQFPYQTFILDHLAKPFIKDQVFSPWNADIEQLAKLPNVFCKLSGMTTEANWKNWSLSDIKPYLDIVFNAFGINRLMIGSDWPVCTLTGKYSQVMEVVTEYIKSLSPSEQALILGENAKKIYKLKME